MYFRSDAMNVSEVIRKLLLKFSNEVSLLLKYGAALSVHSLLELEDTI